jgi:hypothetical protein
MSAMVKDVCCAIGSRAVQGISDCLASLIYANASCLYCYCLYFTLFVSIL